MLENVRRPDKHRQQVVLPTGTSAADSPSSITSPRLAQQVRQAVRARRPLPAQHGLLPGVVCAALAAVHAVWYAPYTTDDVFISLTYARNLALGNGFVYNGGLRVEGYSDFLWILPISVCAVLKLNLVVAAKVLGVACLFATALLTSALARALTPYPWSLTPPILVATSPAMAMWASDGLETPLFALLVTLGVYLEVTRREHPALSQTSGIVFAFAALTRPEGVIFLGLAFLYRVISTGLDRTDWSQDLAPWCVTGVTIVGLFEVWQWSYYESPFPNTVYAKAGGNLVRQVMRGLQYVYQFSRTSGGFLLLLVPLAARCHLHRRELFLAACLGMYVIFIVLAGGDWMPLFRFVVPVLPLAFLLLATSLWRLHQAQPTASSTLAALLVLSLATLSAASSVDGLFINRSTTGQLGPPRTSWDLPPPWVAWVRDHARPGDKVAVVDAGAIAFYTNQPIIDMAGLLDSHVAHLPAHGPDNPLVPAVGYGFGKWDPQYVLSLHPAFIEMHPTTLGSPCPSLTTDWVGTDLLVRDPHFCQDYTPVKAPGITGLFELKCRAAKQC